MPVISTHTIGVPKAISMNAIIFADSLLLLNTENPAAIVIRSSNGLSIINRPAAA